MCRLKENDSFLSGEEKKITCCADLNLPRQAASTETEGGGGGAYFKTVLRLPPYLSGSRGTLKEIFPKDARTELVGECCFLPFLFLLTFQKKRTCIHGVVIKMVFPFSEEIKTGAQNMCLSEVKENSSARNYVFKLLPHCDISIAVMQAMREIVKSWLTAVNKLAWSLREKFASSAPLRSI